MHTIQTVSYRQQAKFVKETCDPIIQDETRVIVSSLQISKCSATKSGRHLADPNTHPFGIDSCQVRSCCPVVFKQPRDILGLLWLFFNSDVAFHRAQGNHSVFWLRQPLGNLGLAAIELGFHCASGLQGLLMRHRAARAARCLFVCVLRVFGSCWKWTSHGLHFCFAQLPEVAFQG